MKIRHRVALLTILAATVAGSSGCGRPAGPAQATNSVRAVMSAEPASYSLIGKTDRSAEILAVQVTDSLVQYDATLRLRPRVAESWEFSDDKLILTFHLRPGVRWHDGEPVTADDVVFTVNRLLEPGVENLTWAPQFRDLESVEAADERTVVARYRIATPEILEGWRVPLIPRHIAGADADLLSGRFAEHPVGCGPFRFSRRVAGREIVLEANDDYWDGRPSIDRLIFKIYPDQRTAYQALLAGDLDVMALTSSLWIDARDDPAAARLERFVYSMLSVWPVIWNQDGSNPYFEDARVRRAMILALDREAFIASVVHGLARPGATTYHPDSDWADPDAEPYPFDPALAKSLLDRAGWTDTDGDGVRDRDGLPFRFTLMIPASTQQLTDQIAVWQQQSWAAVGVSVEIERLEWQSFRERRNAGQFQAASFTLTFTPNPDQYELYHSSARDHGFNFYGLADPEVDRLLETGRRTFDPETRMETYRQLQRRLHEQEFLSCVFYFSTPAMRDRRLDGIRPSPLDFWRTTEGPRRWRWSDAPPGD